MPSGYEERVARPSLATHVSHPLGVYAPRRLPVRLGVYCPTVKSIRFSTVPAASRTSTCHAPVQSAGTVFLLQVRQGELPTASSTSPTWVSPWNQTWWIVVAAVAPVTLVQSTTWPTSTGNAVPVSCGTRSRTDRATTASATLTLTVGAAAGAAACGAGLGAFFAAGAFAQSKGRAANL